MNSNASGLAAVVVADDLTGAADTGIAFVRAGVPTAVCLAGPAGEVPAGEVPGGETHGPVASGARALAIDTDSRDLNPEDAAGRVRAVAGRFRGSPVLYKKIDSTLRGNVAAELAAIDAVASGRVLLAPAFPETGRTVVDGVLRVKGVPLADSGVWRSGDGAPPPDIPTLLAGSGLNPISIPLDTVRRGVPAVLEVLHRTPTPGVAVCDAETDEDLAIVAEAGARLPPPLIWSGSGGLARHLAAVGRLRMSSSGGSSGEESSKSTGPARGPILFVVGSASPVSGEQAAALATSGRAGQLTIPARALLRPSRPAAAQLSGALAVGDTVLTITGTEAIAELNATGQAATALGDLIAPWLGRLGALVATGGQTVRAILGGAGIASFDLHGEIEPGVVAGSAGRLRIVTKAGAFGDAHTFIRVQQALREE